jgi:nicotinate-nucleotide pyrophosphorylase (carboxylating)
MAMPSSSKNSALKKNANPPSPAYLEDKLLQLAIEEDLGPGDFTSLSCLHPTKTGKAVITAKENGVLSGIDVAAKVFALIHPAISFQPLLNNGHAFQKGSIIARLEGPEAAILTAERPALNFLQRMCGVATLTHRVCEQLAGTRTRLLDTRKTTPGFRYFEKKAVLDGGGLNHRFGLFDMILIKDNHIDFCGGITAAIQSAQNYLQQNQLDLPIEVETRNLQEVREVLQNKGIQRIMLDNFSPEEISKALAIIDGRVETEASGGINIDNIRAYAQTGVDFISMGFITHSYRSIDLSLTSIA